MLTDVTHRFVYLQRFPENDVLLRNMMGLLGNVAEVDYLRPKLAVSEYITIFWYGDICVFSHMPVSLFFLDCLVVIDS
jgi:hypothetical protein